MLDKIRIFASGLLVGLVLAAVVVGGYQWRASHVLAAVAPPAKAVSAEPTVTIPCTTLQAKSDNVKRQLKLPAVVVRNPDAHVVAATTEPPSVHQETVTVVADTKTGDVSLFEREEPLPLLSFNRSYDIGAYYGIDDNGFGVLRLDGRADLMQVMALNFGLMGSAQSDRHWFIGVGGHIGWK